MDVVVFSCKDSLYRVGRAKDCDYVLEDPFISRRHFSVRGEDNGYVGRLTVTGKNGVFVNGEKVECGKTEYITEGDFITLKNTAFVYCLSADKDLGKLCGKSFRNEALKLEPIEIEPPPSRRPPEKPSILLAVGPALTMALPIALGLGRTLSLLSGAAAAVWAAVNVVTRQKKSKKEEQRRKALYFRYIEEKKNEILERNREEKQYLQEKYPEPCRYFYDKEDDNLRWKKSALQDAKVRQVRLGCGNSKPMYELIIPKERLSVVDDSLRLLPFKLYDENYILENVPIVGKVEQGSTVVVATESFASPEEVNALIINIAVTFTPAQLYICIKGPVDRIMREYPFIALLPHYGKKDNMDNVTSVIVCEEEKYLADEGGFKRIERVDKYDYLNKKAAYALSKKLNSDWEKHSKTGVILPDVITLRSLNSSKVRYESEENGVKEYCSTVGNIRFPIGIGEDGEVLDLDLSEEADGPHGLIAGTTGSGKSELITSVILSAAVNFPPDELCFFLIDYKGGAMAGSFNKLPHVIGQLTNLSAGQTRRVRIALKGENLRRQELFARYGVNSITEYNLGFNEGRIPDKLPHLVIVVDEFAELKREQPEFMDSLISISQIGRSLGIHLILSTQKPSGVVDDKIRSNTKFKIALRMEDKSDSNDVIGCMDAAFLTGCKTGLIKRGGAFSPEKFQSAYSRGRKRPEGDYCIDLYEDPFLARPVHEYERAGEDISEMLSLYESGDKQKEETCLEYYLREIDNVCTNYNLKRPENLWLNPLCEEIEYCGDYIALADDVDNHCYLKIIYNPLSCGSLLLIGDYGLGAGECLTAIALNLCRIRGSSFTEAIFFYICDFSDGKLKVFENCQYCGGVVTIENYENAQMMLRFLYDEMLRRRREGRSRGIVFIISNYGEFIRSCNDDGGRMIEEILKYGNSVGIYIAASTVDVAMQEMPQRTAMGFDSNMIFGKMDIYRAAQYLKVLPSQIFEIENVIGRGLLCKEGRVLEFQTVHVSEEKLREILEYARGPADFRAPPYPYIPQKPSVEKLLQRAVKEYPPQAGLMYENGIPTGYIKENGRIFLLPVGKVKCILIYSSLPVKRKKIIENISIILGRYKINHYCISPGQMSKSLALLLHENRATSTTNPQSENIKRIALFNDFTEVIREFYKKGVSAQEEEQICNLLDNSTLNIDKFTIIATVSEDIKISLAGKKALDALLRKPYGLTCKEDIFNQRLFDYSYVSYSALKDTKEVGSMYVSMQEEGLYCGEIVCPMDITEKCG